MDAVRVIRLGIVRRTQNGSVANPANRRGVAGHRKHHRAQRLHVEAEIHAGAIETTVTEHIPDRLDARAAFQ